ncbi:MAG: hypothetical protein U0325_11355 [Polyangiales bacterium]
MNHDAAMQQVQEFQAQVERARQDAVNAAKLGTLATGVACALVALGILGAVALGRAPVQSLAGVALLSLFATLSLRSARALRRPEHLAREGIPAVAVFERAVGMGVNIRVSSSSMEGNVSQTRMRVRIEGTPRGPYTTEVTDLIPSAAYGRLVPGTRLRAFVDRTRPDRVLIDWNTAA